MKTVYTIPPDIAFIDALAEGLLREAGDDPLRLSDALILLPTRRACLHLREAFRRKMQGRAALLPRMQPLGDLDEDELYFDSDVNPDIPPAITPLRRQLLLARLILGKEPEMPLDQAALLADALARLLDEVQIERKGFGGLEGLVQRQDLAEHWQATVQFLKILTDSWPLVLAEENAIDPAARRNRLLETQAAAWRNNPPAHPVIAAGSTGSMPATADLLEVIAGLPRGAVILPGLDQTLDEEAWQEIGEIHPQYAMKKLLEQFGVKRTDVKPWSKDISPHPARVRLLQECMRPAETSEAWRELKPADIPAQAFANLARLVLDHPQEEAQAIALMLRGALETPGKTAALVTPDRHLAERVGTLLGRWNIRINDSAGTSLAALPTGGFLLDILKAAVPRPAHVDILSLLKHPLAAFGLDPAECRKRARRIETDIWRNRRERNDAPEKESAAWLQEFREMLQVFGTNWRKPMPLADRIQAHIELAERIAASDKEKGADRLWRGEEGEAAATWLNDWQSAARGFPPLNGADYAELFAGLARTVTVRPAWGLHPRLSILGPLEARLIHIDLMILGGMNEGVWPGDARADPWMSRPMKADFGLPLPERRIGLAAHDFVQLASAPEVVMTRAARSEGAPSVASRFLLQLDTVLRALGHSHKEHDALAPDEPWQARARLLDEPETVAPCPRPEPKPAVKDRPKQLSVTEIGTWRRNPYAIYARHILDLHKLEPLEMEAAAADRGSIIHDALDRFVKKYPEDLPDNAQGELIGIGREIFAAYAEHPEVQAFWWPRFLRIAEWFVDKERERRDADIAVVKTEARGRIALGSFTLKGRADRIDRLPDGSLAIADYKTGGMPTKNEIIAGYEPQLPLLALIAAEGGFENIPAAAVTELAHWKLSGGLGDSEIKTIPAEPSALARKAHEGLEKLIAAFADPAMPYQAVPKPEMRPRYDDYAHLARLQEWGRTEDDA